MLVVQHTYTKVLSAKITRGTIASEFKKINDYNVEHDIMKPIGICICKTKLTSTFLEIVGKECTRWCMRLLGVGKFSNHHIRRIW